MLDANQWVDHANDWCAPLTTGIGEAPARLADSPKLRVAIVPRRANSMAASIRRASSWRHSTDAQR